MEHTTQKDKQYYQCSECGMRYKELEWAQKCEAWCAKHKSCNLDIIAHATPPEDEVQKDGSTSDGAKRMTRFFFSLIGVAASLAFFLVLYWGLRFNSSIGMLISSTYDRPFYFWPYVVLTVGAIALFGVNAALLAYRIRTWGLPKLRGNVKEQGATGLGSLIGIAASACPVCASTILAALGIVGGLAAFPFGGLELKALSVLLLALSTWLLVRDMRKLRQQCEDGLCPAPRGPSYKHSDKPLLLGLLGLVLLFSVLGLNMLKSDPAVGTLVANATLQQ